MSQLSDLPRRAPRDTLAVRLLVVRHELGWSQREASDRTGVPFGTWQGMEQGRETRNLGDHIANIATATGYAREWLMWGGPLESPHADGGSGNELPSSSPISVIKRKVDPVTKREPALVAA